jgi:hypothetical protein
MWFSTGAGVKGTITDDMVQYIVEQMKAPLRRGDVGGESAPSLVLHEPPPRRARRRLRHPRPSAHTYSLSPADALAGTIIAFHDVLVVGEDSDTVRAFKASTQWDVWSVLQVAFFIALFVAFVVYSHRRQVRRAAPTALTMVAPVCCLLVRVRVRARALGALALRVGWGSGPSSTFSSSLWRPSPLRCTPSGGG